MTQHESDVTHASRRFAPLLQRVAGIAAHLVGAVGVAIGAESTLAKRRRDNAGQDSLSKREARREERDQSRHTDRAQEDRADRREARRDHQASREDHQGRDHHARAASHDEAQRAGKNNNNNNNSNNNSNSNNDNNGNNGSSDTSNSDDGEGGNGHGNAGSGFFDSPLARKTQRRANDFDNNQGRDDEPNDDHTTANTDGDGQHFETNSISFTTGPDGLEVVTRNIEFSAPPTPTPTPFPTLTLPERDRLDVFGDRVIAAPTSVPADDGTSSGSAPPPTSDSGTNISTGSRPSPAPPSSDTSGGDNSTDFLS